MRPMTVGDRIKAARKEKGWTQAQLAEAINLKQPTIAEMEGGKLKNWPQHATKIMRALEKPRSYFEDGANIDNTPDLPEADPTLDYESVEVLPTFAGMGGGGTGDADGETALVPRRLIRDELRAKPSDLLMVNVRGDSMEPLFRHGDQILVDRRDTSPTQPGPFALLYDDGYVIKNVELLRKAQKLRVFSMNPLYAPEEFDQDEVKIMGRPVWFARRL